MLAKCWSFGQVEKGLLDGRDECSPGLQLDEASVEVIDVALDEHDLATVVQRDGLVLRRDGDDGHGERPRYGSMDSRGTQSHQSNLR